MSSRACRAADTGEVNEAFTIPPTGWYQDEDQISHFVAAAVPFPERFDDTVVLVPRWNELDLDTRFWEMRVKKGDAPDIWAPLALARLGVTLTHLDALSAIEGTRRPLPTQWAASRLTHRLYAIRKAAGRSAACKDLRLGDALGWAQVLVHDDIAQRPGLGRSGVREVLSWLASTGSGGWVYLLAGMSAEEIKAGRASGTLPVRGEALLMASLRSGVLPLQ